MIILTDILRHPVDEGAKVTSVQLLTHCKQNSSATVVSINSDDRFDFVDEYVSTNKLLFDLSFYLKLRSNPHREILYIPESSVTVASYVRAFLLRLFSGKTVSVYALQPRKYGGLAKFFIKLIKPSLVITQSAASAAYLEVSINVETRLLPLGVDNEKYTEFSAEKKKLLKEKYDIGLECPVLLHVGHVKPSRNLDWFIKIKENIPEFEIIIIGSTYNPEDETLSSSLRSAGIKVIRGYIPDIEELYNIADFYVFPVLRADGAIETPLSVLEAMACNVSIITTPFGSLPDMFVENENFHYVNSCEEAVEVLGKGKNLNCDNRAVVRPFTWQTIAKQLIEIVD